MGPYDVTRQPYLAVGHVTREAYAVPPRGRTAGYAEPYDEKVVHGRVKKLGDAELAPQTRAGVGPSEVFEPSFVGQSQDELFGTWTLLSLKTRRAGVYKCARCAPKRHPKECEEESRVYALVRAFVREYLELECGAAQL